MLAKVRSFLLIYVLVKNIGVVKWIFVFPVGYYKVNKRHKNIYLIKKLKTVEVKTKDIRGFFLPEENRNEAFFRRPIVEENNESEIIEIID